MNSWQFVAGNRFVQKNKHESGIRMFDGGMMSDDERRRIERIRQQQIDTRNPGESKIPGYDWGKHAQRGAQIKKKIKRESGLRGIWLLMPSRMKGLVTAGSIGLVVSVVVFLLLPDYWRPLAIIPLLLLGIAGWVLGAAVQE